MVLGLLLSAAALRADLAGAQAAYKKGLDLVKAKQYQEAISAFEASLAAEPRYAYSWKYIGTCRYYLGDKPGPSRPMTSISPSSRTIPRPEPLPTRYARQCRPRPRPPCPAP
jgi:tetratricopeptide (TPR) repeat protein